MKPVYNHLSVERIQQTDFRLSGMKAVDPKNNVIRDSINYWGCLFMSLCSVAEEHVGSNLSAQEKTDMYLDMVELNRDNVYRGMKATCFIMNHEDILSSALAYLNESNHRPYYVFKEVNAVQTYLKGREEYKGSVNARIEQWMVAGGHFSHFVHTSTDGRIIYNPYPQLPLERLLSIRGYYIE